MDVRGDREEGDSAVSCAAVARRRVRACARVDVRSRVFVTYDQTFAFNWPTL